MADYGRWLLFWGINDSTILINEECYRLAENSIEAREIDLVTVFGKIEPVRIFELQGRQGSLDPKTSKLNKQTLKLSHIPVQETERIYSEKS